MVLRSYDSSRIHSDNKPYDFRVHLPTPFSLSGFWSASLLEFSVKLGNTPTPLDLLVCCNICDDTIVGEKEIPLLRRVYLQNLGNVIYSLPIEVPLRIGQFGDVHVYIKGADGNEASFIQGDVTVTTQLKHLPFHI